MILSFDRLEALGEKERTSSRVLRHFNLGAFFVPLFEIFIVRSRILEVFANI